MRQQSLARCALVDDMLTRGMVITEACTRAGVSVPTYYRYQREMPTAEPLHCKCCDILIFRDREKARAHGAPWIPIINRAVGDLCAGCASEGVA